MLSGRAWLEHGISRGFSSTVYDEHECEKVVSNLFPDREFKPSATIVSWSHLYRVGQSHGSPAEHAQKLMRRLENHLAIAFHRFLSGRARKVRILIELQSVTLVTLGYHSSSTRWIRSVTRQAAERAFPPR